MDKLIFATKNRGKLQEMRLAVGKELELIGIEDISASLATPLESGESYLQNAKSKAAFYHDAVCQPVLADDGGLELLSFPDLLGVRTHAFFKSSDPLQQNQEILQLFSKQPEKERGFVLHAVLVYRNETMEISASKQLRGKIVTPRGENGYGFDPILYIPDADKTLGEMNTVQRNALSPRINALKEILPKIKAIRNDL